MPGAPVSEEIAAALGAFFSGGLGPTHSVLSGVFAGAGYADADPYNPVMQGPNKETRVQLVISAACRRPGRGRELVEALLARLRASGAFSSNRYGYDPDVVRVAKRAFARAGWQLDDDGLLSPAGPIDVSTGGRQALNDQIERLKRATDDPALLIGTSKDLLEAVAKFVLEEFQITPRANASFADVWYAARGRLGLLPERVPNDTPGAQQIRTILQSSWRIAEQVNELRAVQGTGHGRTLPSAMTAEMALLVVREACSVAELMLTTLDRMLGD